jgi:uncharacterized protein YraI
MPRRGWVRRLAVAAGCAPLLVGLPGAAASAATVPKASPTYAAGATATVYTGRAFETCTAPPLSAITAWNASPYRAVGVYIGGIDRTCAQPRLTASWVSTVAGQGWRLIPIYKGLQAPCGSAGHPIDPAAARSEGRAAADDAVASASALGMLGGSAIYYDMEYYPPGIASCKTAVLTFLSAWTSRLHRLGYVVGVYAQLYSGAADLASVYGSASYARPDALWVARYDRNRSLTGWAGIPDSYWTRHQRAKQYRGSHNETHGGVTLNIDNDQWNTPVATVGYPYQVTGASIVQARSGPARSYRLVRSYAAGSALTLSCQAPGQRIGSTSVWDKLADGSYVTDYYVSTPSNTGYSVPLPRCAYPFQVTAAAGLSVHSGPGTSYPVTATMALGALAWITCQQSGSKVGTTSVWDMMTSGRWVTDYHVTTPSSTTYSPPIPHC